MSDNINLTGPSPDPITFEGPLNVFIQLQGTAAAYVRSAEIKQAYDGIKPDATPARMIDPVRHDPNAPPPPPTLFGAPISAGRAIVPDGSKYMIDRDIQRRLK